jgi:glycosyltransferase involved in cell wall biosynthesis
VSTDDLNQVILAPLLIGSSYNARFATNTCRKESGSARVIFLSRIHPVKNLALALEILSGVGGKIEFDIFGPIQDLAYWRKCETLINALPDNVKVQYKGQVEPESVESVFSLYHLFLFPTKTENFGYVITEALSAGCPVATSDQTPWKDLNEKNAGWWIPLSQVEMFRAAVETVVAMDAEKFTAMSSAARMYSKAVYEDATRMDAYRRLLREGMAGGIDPLSICMTCLMFH